MPLPTPDSAATARANPNFFGNILHTFLTRAPILGPLYNTGGTLAHAAEGTLGQFGPATTPLGRLLSIFSSNPTNAPAATAVDPFAPPSSAPSAAAAPTPAAPGSSGAPSGGQGPAPGYIQQAWNTGRLPGAPAFYPTVPQALFPGSPIGPTSGAITNAYDPANPLSPAGPEITSIPAFAQLLAAWVRARNQV